MSGHKLMHIRSDHGNKEFDDLSRDHGQDQNFYAHRTPQQNDVVERKTKTLKEMARIILIASELPRNFWTEAVNTACRIINRAMMRPIINKTPYELYFLQRNPILHISEHLVVNILFIIMEKIILENLMQRVMKK